jgi:hypothetical protein
MQFIRFFSILAWIIILTSACRTSFIKTAAAFVNPPREGAAAILDHYGGYQCPDNALTCERLYVPFDYFNSATSKRIDVVLAVLPGTGDNSGQLLDLMEVGE